MSRCTGCSGRSQDHATLRDTPPSDSQESAEQGGRKAWQVTAVLPEAPAYVESEDCLEPLLRLIAGVIAKQLLGETSNAPPVTTSDPETMPNAREPP